MKYSIRNGAIRWQVHDCLSAYLFILLYTRYSQIKQNSKSFSLQNEDPGQGEENWRIPYDRKCSIPCDFSKTLDTWQYTVVIR